MLAEQVFQSPGLDPVKGIPYLGVETDMPEKTFGIMDIDLFRRDIEITAPDGGHDDHFWNQIIPESGLPLKFVGNWGFPDGP